MLHCHHEYFWAVACLCKDLPRKISAHSVHTSKPHGGLKAQPRLSTHGQLDRKMLHCHHEFFWAVARLCKDLPHKISAHSVRTSRPRRGLKLKTALKHMCALQGNRLHCHHEFFWAVAHMCMDPSHQIAADSVQTSRPHGGPKVYPKPCAARQPAALPP